VAHFGRGRGDWVHGEDPRAWVELVQPLVAARAPQLEALWASAQRNAGSEEAEVPAALHGALTRELRGLVAQALTRLYPEAREILPEH
jgi:hypothetical protein